MKLIAIKKYAAVILLYIGIFSPLFATAEETTSQWNIVLAKFKLPNQWHFFLDMQPRFDLEPSEAHGKEGVRQLLVRPGIGYQWTDNFQTYLAYTLVESYSPHQTEHDVIQDFIFNGTFFIDVPSMQRLRTEQRFLETDGEVFHRWRYLHQINFPFLSFQETSFIVNDEVFFNLNDIAPGKEAGFSENRAFVGLGFDIFCDSLLTLGYMNRYHEGRSGSGSNMNHIISTSLVFNYDFSSWITKEDQG